MTNLIKSYAIRYLALREHSIHELKVKLLKKNFEGHEIDLIINELLRENLLSEYRFVESYITARSNKGFGPNAIKNELKLKKIDEDLIEKVLSELNLNWSEVIQKVFDKKFSSKIPFEAKEKAKCWRFLQQRGFTSDQINAILKIN